MAGWYSRYGLSILMVALLAGPLMAQVPIDPALPEPALPEPVPVEPTQVIQVKSKKEKNRNMIAITGQDAPLSVPVFPKRDSEDKKLPEGADLRDQYILLDDGSVLSMADWILGALGKTDLYREMSDAEQRIFLGEVARSMAKKGRLLGARPGVPLPPPEPLVEPLPERPAGILANRVPYLFTSPEVATIANGVMRDQGIHRSGAHDILGTSDPAELNGGKISLLPDPLEVAVNWHREEWQYRGTQLIMLEEFKRKLAKEKKSE